MPSKPVIPYLLDLAKRPTAKMPTMGRKPVAVGGYARSVMEAPRADTISMSTPVTSQQAPDPALQARLDQLRQSFREPAKAAWNGIVRQQADQTRQMIDNTTNRYAALQKPLAPRPSPAAPLQAATQQIASNAPHVTRKPIGPTPAAAGRYVTGYGQPAIKPAADVGRFSTAETRANGERMLAIAKARGAKTGELNDIATRYGLVPQAPVVASQAAAMAQHPITQLASNAAQGVVRMGEQLGIGGGASQQPRQPTKVPDGNDHRVPVGPEAEWLASARPIEDDSVRTTQVQNTRPTAYYQDPRGNIYAVPQGSKPKPRTVPWNEAIGNAYGRVFQGRSVGNDVFPDTEDLPAPVMFPGGNAGPVRRPMSEATARRLGYARLPALPPTRTVRR